MRTSLSIEALNELAHLARRAQVTAQFQHHAECFTTVIRQFWMLAEIRQHRVKGFGEVAGLKVFQRSLFAPSEMLVSRHGV